MRAAGVREAREVRAVEEAAVTWLSAHRDDFVLPEDALAPDGRVNSTWKPLGELAQVCVSVRRHTARTDPVHACVSDLLDFAWRQTRHGALFLQLQRLEPFATYPLEVYATFASAGLRHLGYEAAAATVARTRGWQLTEQQPTRRLGVRKAERRSGIHRPEPGPEAVRRTWLGGLSEPWTFERSSGYQLTHVVFHLTDWGRTSEGLPSDVAAYLADWLPPWLDTCLEARDWDLTCELLAVAATLPRPLDPVTLRDAWTGIAAAQHTSGALPERAGAEGPEQHFAGAYHSTLMAAFAAALTLGRAERHGGQGVPV
ncbi:DUF6895 family protein [Streptomyces poonensis]|uniref:DUF6895 domain-containing protein n=1 Tax=Streptomyces poonensis TaxID=68255 RepID=A0A918PCZ4_9ACTN|nr:hypothetical protein [Streptomyces poonensis]GGY99759.1 hypothetical protein GCM10010365_18110 [Streptomyces poonensis]GLJ92200.1 hypothetical protein GCM10017589_48090 [Streptomyces poonensis]